MGGTLLSADDCLWSLVNWYA